MIAVRYSYLSTCRKNRLPPTKALELLSAGEAPAFMLRDIGSSAKVA